MIYDYTIIGTGAAGLQLALRMVEDPFFKDKQVLLIDRVEKKQADRTWCFWEEGNGRWDEIIHKSWDKTNFYGPDKTLSLSIQPYKYKMLRSEDFYASALKTISKHDNFHWEIGEVEKTKEGKEKVDIFIDDKTFQSYIVFDSRVPEPFYLDKSHSQLKQHFKGWFIKTEEDVFDEETFTIMDFRMPYKETTSFMYILPFDARNALLEFTFFSEEVYEDELYDRCIDSYISDFLPEAKKHEVWDTEFGVIPMTTYPFNEHNTPRRIKIGTAGGWVRPSTGYTFKNCERFVTEIIDRIKKGRSMVDISYDKKYLWYDKIFLDVLERDNQSGPKVFEQMYRKISIPRIFRFLGGTTSFWDDLVVMSSFKPTPFLSSLLRLLKGRK